MTAVDGAAPNTTAYGHISTHFLQAMRHVEFLPIISDEIPIGLRHSSNNEAKVSL